MVLAGSVDRIGNYRVERVLGAGSFATVWLATDELLDAKVAIKVLADNWSRQPDIRRRFIDEAKILRRLDDDRVVRVHQVDEMADGRPFFVMTWADRATLFDRIQDKARQQRPFEVAEAVQLTIEIAACLDVVHGFGVVHRDIKPSNVLFRSAVNRLRPAGARRDPTGVQPILVAGTPPGGGGAGLGPDRMMLGDFGLAKDLAGASGFTFAAGTPAYMAPEQARSSTDIDERADVFSATAVLYELLTGRPAFSAETLSGVARSHQGRELVPLPSARPDAPPMLWQVIRRGLAPAVEDRIGSAEELIAALEGAMAGRVSLPPSGGPPPPPTISARPPQAFGPPPPPLPVLVAQALALIDQLAQQVNSVEATDTLVGARRRLLGPVQVMVVGTGDGTTSELAWGLAGERLSPASRGGHGRVMARLQAAPSDQRRNTVVEVLTSGARRNGRIEADATGALAVQPAGADDDVAVLLVSLASPGLDNRTVIDAGPLLDRNPTPPTGAAGRAVGNTGGPAGVGSVAGMLAELAPERALAEADLLAVVLPPSIEGGRGVLQRLRDRLRISPGGPVLAMGVVSPGPGSTLGGPGSLPTAVAEMVAAYNADPAVSAQLSAVSALTRGRAPMVDGAFEALLRHSDAVRVTAALAQAEEGLSRYHDPAARAAFHALRDGREALVTAFPALEELAVLREEASGRLTLPASYRNELRRLLAGGDPAARLGLAPGAGGAELRQSVEAALERWRTFVNTGRAPFASIHASQTVVRALERLWTGSQQRS